MMNVLLKSCATEDRPHREPGQREHTKPQNAHEGYSRGFIYYNAIIIQLLNESSDRISFLSSIPELVHDTVNQDLNVGPYSFQTYSYTLIV